MSNDSREITSANPSKEFDRLSPAEQEALLELVRVHGVAAIRDTMNGRVGSILEGDGANPDAEERNDGPRHAGGEISSQMNISEQMFLMSSLGTAIFDRDGRCERVNPKFLEIFGIDSGYVMGKHYHAFDDDTAFRVRVVPNLEIVFRDGKISEWEVLYDIGSALDSKGMEAKEKKSVWLSCRAFPIFDGNGKVERVVVQLVDTSSRKRMEDENVALKNGYLSILEALPEELFEIDAKGVCYSHHSQRNDLIPNTPEEFVGKNLNDFYPTDVMNIFRSALQEAEATGYSRGMHFSLGLPQWRKFFEISVSRKSGYDPMRFILLIRDVTVQKHEQALLLSNERRLQSIFNAANVGLSVTGKDGRFVMFNDCLRKLLGYTEEEMYRLDSMGMCHPDDREASLERYVKNREGTWGKYHAERRFMRKDGSFFWGDLAVSTVNDENGKMLYVVGMVTDLTERKERERLLAKSQEKLKTIDKMTNVGFAFADATGKYTFFNAWFADHLGYSEEELLKLSIKELTHPEDRAASEAKFHELVRGDIDEYRLEKRYVRKDGSFFWADLSVSAIRDGNGQIVSIIGMVTDDTHVKNAEFELTKAKNQLKAILEAVPDFLFELGLNGSVLNFYSKQRLRIDSAVENIVGKNLGDFLSDEAASVCMLAIQEANRTGFSEGRQMFVQTPEANFWFELSVSRKSNEPGSVRSFILLARNITARKNMEDSLSEGRKRYQELVENAPISIHEIDTDGNFRSINSAGMHMMHFSTETEIVGMPFLDLVDMSDFDRIRELLDLAREWKPNHFEYRGNEPERRAYKSCFIPIKNSKWGVEKILGITEDVTGQKEAAAQMIKLATHDSLTGLANRILLNDRLDHALRLSKRNGDSCALFFIDLDNFKPVNDKHGHDVWDILLKMVAERLESITRESDTVARLWGDEFIVVSPGLKSEEDADMIAEKIVKTLSGPFYINKREIVIGGSVGKAMFPRDGNNSAELMKKGDAAMYLAKRAGKGTSR